MSEKQRLYVLVSIRETSDGNILKKCIFDTQLGTYDKLTRQLAERARVILGDNEYGYPRVYDLSYSDRILEVRYVEDINIVDTFQIVEQEIEV